MPFQRTNLDLGQGVVIATTFERFVACRFNVVYVNSQPVNNVQVDVGIFANETFSTAGNTPLKLVTVTLTADEADTFVTQPLSSLNTNQSGGSLHTGGGGQVAQPDVVSAIYGLLNSRTPSPNEPLTDWTQAVVI